MPLMANLDITVHFWYVAYATFLFLGSGADASLELWALFMLHALLQLLHSHKVLI